MRVLTGFTYVVSNLPLNRVAFSKNITLFLELTPDPFIDLDICIFPNSSLNVSMRLCFNKLITSFASWTVASSLKSIRALA